MKTLDERINTVAKIMKKIITSDEYQVIEEAIVNAINDDWDEAWENGRNMEDSVYLEIIGSSDYTPPLFNAYFHSNKDNTEVEVDYISPDLDCFDEDFEDKVTTALKKVGYLVTEIDFESHGDGFGINGIKVIKAK